MKRKKSLSSVKLSHRDFEKQIDDLAGAYGWLVAGFRPARVIRDGVETWRTAIVADGAGFPDRVLTKGRRTIFAELKREDDKLSPEQAMWLEALAENPSNEVYCWRPSEYEQIVEILGED